MGYRLEAAASAPLSSNLAERIAVFYNYRQPLLKNLYPAGAVGGSPGPGAGANLDNDNTLGVRSTTLFKPNDTSTITFQVNYARSRLDTAPYQEKPTIAHFNSAGELVNVTNVGKNETRASINDFNGTDHGSDVDNNGVFGDTFGRPAGADFFGYIDPDGKGFKTSSDFAFKNQGGVRTFGADLTGEFEISDGITLTSVTDYKHFNKLLFVDVDSGPGNQAANYQGVRASTLSQEVRLNGKSDRLNWVVGAYYLNINDHAINGLKFPIGSVVPGAPFDLGLQAHLVTNSFSGFGQVDWKFADKFKLIVGGRVIREQKKYNFFQGIWGTTNSRQAQTGPLEAVIGPGPLGQPYADKNGQTLWAGKVQLEYQPNNDLLVYFGVEPWREGGQLQRPTFAGGLPTPCASVRSATSRKCCCQL